MSNPPYRLTETAAPASEPVTLSEAKVHLRVDHSADDAAITSLVTSARMLCENFTNRAFITRMFSLYLDAWPAQGGAAWWDGVREGAFVTPENMVLLLPKAPLFSVTDIRLYDAENDVTTFSAANYFVDTTGPQGRIVLKDSAAVPIATRNANGIEIRFTAGYGSSASAVPSPLREAVKQMVAHMYENRGDGEAGGLPSSARGLLQPYRLAGLS